MATVYYPNGRVHEDVLPNDQESGFSLSELREIIDCELIEPFTLSNGHTLVFDEEAKLYGSEFNELASYVAGFELLGVVVECWPGEFK